MLDTMGMTGVLLAGTRGIKQSHKSDSFHLLGVITCAVDYYINVKYYLQLLYCSL